MMPSFEGNLLTQRHQITSLETRNSRLSYGENPMSLFDLGLIRYRVVTPGQTDRQTEFPQVIRAQYLPVQLSRVITDKLLKICQIGHLLYFSTARITHIKRKRVSLLFPHFPT